MWPLYCSSRIYFKVHRFRFSSTMLPQFPNTVQWFSAFTALPESHHGPLYRNNMGLGSDMLTSSVYKLQCFYVMTGDMEVGGI